MGRITALIVGGLGLASLPHGAAPLATDDAGVLEARACEIETYAQRQREAGAADPMRGASLAFGCGFGARSQVGLGYARTGSAAGHDAALGVAGKTALLAPDGPFGLALAWRLNALRAAGSSGLRHDGSALVLIASRPLGADVTVHANLGWARSRAAHASSTTWNLAAEAALGAGVEALAEVYGDDREPPWRAIGARWSPTPQTSFGLSWAQQAAQPRSRTTNLGLKLGF